MAEQMNNYRSSEAVQRGGFCVSQYMCCGLDFEIFESIKSLNGKIIQYKQEGIIRVLGDVAKN